MSIPNYNNLYFSIICCRLQILFSSLEETCKGPFKSFLTQYLQFLTINMVNTESFLNSRLYLFSSSYHKSGIEYGTSCF